MCEAYGDPIDWSKCPADLEDFPDYVVTALSIFNSLPDRYTSTMESVIYTGKDFAALPAMFDIFNVEDRDEKLLVFEVIEFLDGRAREQALKASKKK